MTGKINHIKRIMTLVFCVVSFSSFFNFARQPALMNGAELKIALQKMLNLGSVLYIAAHPDDENTAVLAYMSRERLMRTGYLSLTRGGGGQNLIGSEKGPLMSVIRTHELLEARKIDWAEQFFTRAKDFGYSKTAEESFNIWGKENVLADVVYVIRKFRPDILLSRFSPRPGKSGHGHHTASAILAVEAFKAAGDPNRFPEQLSVLTTWKPKRIFWNDWRPYWRPKEITPEEREKLIAIDVGTYNPLLGQSYYEIAATSRSMHKSQGFGAMPRRGKWLDYFNLLAGVPARRDLFEGIDTSWDRVAGSKRIKQLLERANRTFDIHHPHTIVPVLMAALAELRSLPQNHWTIQKTRDLKEVIRSCSGLWLEAITSTHTVSPGMDVKVISTVIIRSGILFSLKKFLIPWENRAIPVQKPLLENIPLKQEFSVKITSKQFTQPYWLREKPGPGIYFDGDERLKGMAIEPYPLNLKVVLESSGLEVCFDVPMVYRWRNPVEGERIREINIMPPATLNFTDRVFYFIGKESRKIGMVLRSGPLPVSGILKINLPSAWKVKPNIIPFQIDEPFFEKRISADITPPSEDSSCDLTVNLTVNGKTVHHSQEVIEYHHLPVLKIHPRAEARMVRVDLKRKGDRIGYVMGSGDDIPTYLTQVGYRVEILSDEDLENQDLSEFDTIVMGIRAFNTRDILKNCHKRLLNYVFNGGVLIVQYNVSRGLKVQQLGPYPFKISRKRVSEETAPVTFLKATHTLFHYPNQIQPDDFKGWIQERGLYFADQWDSEYVTLISCCDGGEKSQEGGLLFARYGKGVFFYTGYSFFRQIPAGIPGALKLFVNMIDVNRIKKGN